MVPGFVILGVGGLAQFPAGAGIRFGLYVVYIYIYIYIYIYQEAVAVPVILYIYIYHFI